MKASSDATKGKEGQETREENLKLSIRKSYYGTTIARNGLCRRSDPPPSCIYVPVKNGKLSMPRLPWGQSGAVIVQEIPHGLRCHVPGRPTH
jgi:hypothetical protein